MQFLNFEKISYRQLIKNYYSVSGPYNLPELLRETLIRKTVSHNDHFNGVNMSYNESNVEEFIYLSWLSPDTTAEVMLF